MALFANSLDLAQRHGPTPKLASCHFVASAKSTAALAESGHSALSAPSQIIGRFQMLKTLQHANLCEYVEIHRGKHDRLFVVSEYYDHSLQKVRTLKEKPSISMIQQLAWEIALALKYLRENDIIHACLSPHNILLDAKGHVKLFGYGLYTMAGGGADVDFPIGYPPYLAPECITENDLFASGNDKRDYWALAVILLEQYTQSPFWATTDIGIIFDSLVRLNEWAAELEDNKDVWHHSDIGSLSISADSLAFLQGSHIPDDFAAFHAFVLECLQTLPERRWGIWEIVSSRLLNDVPAPETAWVRGPVLASDALDNEQQSSEASTDVLSGLPIMQIYHLWTLAGGDVELDYAKRNSSTPVIERLPRVCNLDRTEIGAKSADRSILYTDSVHILDFKELYSRLDENSQTHSDRLELKPDYFSLPEGSDINFMLDDDTLTVRDGEDDEVLYLDDIMQAHPSAGAVQTPLPTPTTPSTSRSMNRSLSTSGMSRSESSSSLAPASPTSMAPTLTITAQTQLSQREQNVNYQYRRLVMFSALLRQYPASRRELIHHASIDIPPLLRGKVWAAILGVRGDVERAYSRVDKYTDKGAHRQIELDVPRCHQYNQHLASSVGHKKLIRLLRAWVSTNDRLDYWQGLDSICAPFLTLNFNDEALAFACLEKFIPKFLTNFFLEDNSKVLDEYLAVFRHLQSYHDPQLASHMEKIEFEARTYAVRWFMTLFSHSFPLDKIYALWDKLMLGPESLPLFIGVAMLQQIRDKILSVREFNDCIHLFSDKFPSFEMEKCTQRAMALCRRTPPSVAAREYGQQPSGARQPSALPAVDKQKELAPRISAEDAAKVLPFALTLDIRPEADFKESHVQSSIHVKTSELESYKGALRKIDRKYHVVIDTLDGDGPAYAAELVHFHFPRVALLQTDPSLQGLPRCQCRPQKQTTAARKGKGSDAPFEIWRCKIPLPLKNREL